MIVTRATIIKKNKDQNSYLVSIPSLNSSSQEVNAVVCYIPGQSSAYSTNQSVYVAWLDSSEWIIIGSVTMDISNNISDLVVEKLIASSGKLGTQFQIGNTNVTLGDLVNFYRNFSDKLSMGGIQR